MEYPTPVDAFIVSLRCALFGHSWYGPWLEETDIRRYPVYARVCQVCATKQRKAFVPDKPILQDGVLWQTQT